MNKTILDLIVNTALLIAGLAMAFSGLLIQAEYHMEGHGSIDTGKMVLGFIYSVWSDIHIFSSIFVAIAMAFHIVKHWKWYKVVVKKRLFAKNRQVLTLTLIFVIVAITGFIPGIIDLYHGDQILRKTFIEIHDKIALILFVYLVFHVTKRFKWYSIAFKSN